MSKKTHPGEVKLQRVICGEGHQKSPVEVLWQWAAVVVQEQMVIAEGRHGNADLGQVVEILHAGNLQAEGEGMKRGRSGRKRRRRRRKSKSKRRRRTEGSGRGQK